MAEDTVRIMCFVEVQNGIRCGADYVEKLEVSRSERGAMSDGDKQAFVEDAMSQYVRYNFLEI